MINHTQRFSFPETIARPSGAVVPPSFAPQASANLSPMAMLAQLYAMAYEQARQSLAQRQWDELLDLLFNSPA